MCEFCVFFMWLVRVVSKILIIYFFMWLIEVWNGIVVLCLIYGLFLKFLIFDNFILVVKFFLLFWLDLFCCVCVNVIFYVIVFIEISWLRLVFFGSSNLLK